MGETLKEVESEVSASLGAGGLARSEIDMRARFLVNLVHWLVH